jgi:uncharacterized membrane protein YhaH (DUF805 family)
MDTQQSQHVGAAIAGMMGFFLLFGLAVLAFFIFLYWRIFTKAGLSGPLSLLVLVPGVGPIIVVCILAFADWKVVPIAQYPIGLQPYPPPPPPPSYPPPPPPTL